MRAADLEAFLYGGDDAIDVTGDEGGGHGGEHATVEDEHLDVGTVLEVLWTVVAEPPLGPVVGRIVARQIRLLAFSFQQLTSVIRNVVVMEIRIY